MTTATYPFNVAAEVGDMTGDVTGYLVGDNPSRAGFSVSKIELQRQPTIRIKNAK